MRVGPVLPSIAVSEGRVQLCAVLSSWPSVAIGVTDINPDHSCSRARGTDMNDPWKQLRPGCHCGPEWASRPPTSTCSSLSSPLQTRLSPQAMAHSVSFIHHCIFAHPNRASVFSSRPWECMWIFVFHCLTGTWSKHSSLDGQVSWHLGSKEYHNITSPKTSHSRNLLGGKDQEIDFLCTGRKQ